MIFCQWIPEGEDFSLSRNTNDVKSRIWIDKFCIWSVSRLDDNYLSRWANITVCKVYLEVDVKNVPDELSKFIYEERDSPKSIHYGISPEHHDYKRLHQDYQKLGLKVFEAALTTFNRLISYVRNHKAQFWLQGYPIDFKRMSSLNNSFQTKVKSEDYEWFRWCPPGEISITVHLPREETSIKSEDWPQIQSFVASDERPDLILELLANSELLLNEDRRRSAIVEAASALEKTVMEIRNLPASNHLKGIDIFDRLYVKNIHSQIEHLGFTGTVRYLLPLLFPEEILPKDILKSCQELIDIRNNIIHHGQRDVSPDKVRPLVFAVRNACEILSRYRN